MLAHAKTTHQPRSQKTRDAILDASVQLLEDHSFAELSIQQIVVAAGCSVGTFYGRFKDKETLLKCLDEKLRDETVASIAKAFSTKDWTNLELKERVRTLIEILTRYHKANRGVLRALILVPRLHPAKHFVETGEDFSAGTNTLVELLRDGQVKTETQISKLSAELAIATIFSSLREIIVFPDSAIVTDDVRAADIVNELTNMIYGYLGG